MSQDVLERLFRFVSQEYESVWFIWHGGEPLLLPLSFYKNAIDLQERYFGRDSHRVGNTIQTNGILLDRGFMNFCKEKKINLGISHEGPYNDALRQQGDASWKNLCTLCDKDRVFSVSSTISSQTESKQTELYRFFRDKGMSVSFSPVIPAGCAKDRKTVPDVEKYIKSSIETFDEWLFDKDSEIPLIPHYLYVLNALGEPTESDCAHSSCLSKWLCMDPNGDMYPCGKGCPSEYRLCNISDVDSISEVFSTEGFVRMLKGSVERRERCKEICEIYRFCNGGCSIDAHYECGIENIGGDSCRMFKEIFGHVSGTIDRMVEERPDLSTYNRFVRDAVLTKLINPKKDM